MFDVFKSVQDFLKFDHVRIDNDIFRLHYKATVVVFVTASLLVTSGQYIGDPIDCIVDGVPGGIMDTYCWIHSTFSIPSRWTGKLGVDVPHYGLSPMADLQPGEEVKYHKYYQWVCFFLFLEAILFYLPRYIWKSSEGGKISMLVDGLKEPIIDEGAKLDQITKIVNYYVQSRGKHTLYASRFFMCEVLNFINVIAQIYFIDYFLDNEFQTYGLDVLSFTEMEAEDRPDPMVKVFPKVTKCTFHKYGPSGTIEKKDGLCVLPLNIINEKIFVFVWFWLIMVAVITGVFLVYRIAVLAGPQIRVALIAAHGGKSTQRSDIEAIIEPAAYNWPQKIGDWLVLHLVCKNLHPLLVNKLVKELHNAEFGVHANSETLKLHDAKARNETSQV